MWDMVRAAATSKDVEVWPENWEVFRLFEQLGTQWRVDFGTETGLDYAAVIARLRMLQLDRGLEEAAFQDIRTMERAALDAIAARRPR